MLIVNGQRSKQRLLFHAVGIAYLFSSGSAERLFKPPPMENPEACRTLPYLVSLSKGPGRFETAEIAQDLLRKWCDSALVKTQTRKHGLRYSCPVCFDGCASSDARVDVVWLHWGIDKTKKKLQIYFGSESVPQEIGGTGSNSEWCCRAFIQNDGSHVLDRIGNFDKEADLAFPCNSISMRSIAQLHVSVMLGLGVDRFNVHDLATFQCSVPAWEAKVIESGTTLYQNYYGVWERGGGLKFMNNDDAAMAIGNLSDWAQRETTKNGNVPRDEMRDTFLPRLKDFASSLSKGQYLSNQDESCDKIWEAFMELRDMKRAFSTKRAIEYFEVKVQLAWLYQRASNFADCGR